MKNVHEIFAFFRAPSPKMLLCILALASLSVLGGALISQYGFGLYPCELCLYQRYPYVLVVLIGFFAAILPVSDKLRVACVILCVLLLLVDAGIAFYHTGVELEWFAGPDACSNAGSEGMTLEEMRKQLMEAPLVSCSQAMGYVLGLSLAAWNTIIALSLAAYGIHALRKGRGA